MREPGGHGRRVCAVVAGVLVGLPCLPALADDSLSGPERPPATAVESAPEESPVGYYRWGVTLSGALHDADLRGVNQALWESRYSLLRERAMTLGLGLSLAVRGMRLMLDGELDVYGRRAYRASSEAPWSEARFSLAGGPDFTILGGYLAPVMGFTLASDTIHFPAGQAPFLVKAVGSEASALSRDSILLDLGVAFEYPVIRGQLPTRGRTAITTAALLLGVRLGYHWQVFASDWYVGPTGLGRSPDFDLSGWFVRLTLGGGVETKAR